MPQMQMIVPDAARVLSKSPLEFMLESFCNAAENVLMDHVNFTLTDEQFKALEQMLDSAATPDDALRKFVKKRDPWGQE